jgi:hypothetical protein
MVAGRRGPCVAQSVVEQLEKKRLRMNNLYIIVRMPKERRKIRSHFRVKIFIGTRITASAACHVNVNLIRDGRSGVKMAQNVEENKRRHIFKGP